MNLIPIEYRNIPYPNYIACNIKEVAGNFDKPFIEIDSAYSLHTEYSYGKRNFDTPLISKYTTLKESNKEGIPQLWKSAEWAKEFADFVIELTAKKEPTIIEIHPSLTTIAIFLHLLKDIDTLKIRCCLSILT